MSGVAATYPSLVDAVHAAERGAFLRARDLMERSPTADSRTGSAKSDCRWRIWRRAIAASAMTLPTLASQPRRILTSPCWSGIVNDGRAYSGFVMNVERLVPWRTLTGRQHLYQDHEAYRAFGESCPTFKPRISSRRHVQYCQEQAGREVHHPGLHHASRKMAYPLHLLRRFADAHAFPRRRTVLAE